jgi:hypothetical protein
MTFKQLVGSIKTAVDKFGRHLCLCPFLPKHGVNIQLLLSKVPFPDFPGNGVPISRDLGKPKSFGIPETNTIWMSPPLLTPSASSLIVCTYHLTVQQQQTTHPHPACLRKLSASLVQSHLRKCGSTLRTGNGPLTLATSIS